MDDLIRRQDAIDALQKEINKGTPPFNDVIGSIRCGVRLARNIIEDLPPAQKKGRWNFIGDNLFKCTCCGEMYTTQQLNGLRVYDKDPYCPFFCPHCGADMRGDEDG